MNEHHLPSRHPTPRGRHLHLALALAPRASADELEDAETVGAIADKDEAVFARRVTQSVASVQRALDDFLTANLYQIAHRGPERSIWRADQSPTARIRRALDLHDRYRLPDDGAVNVEVVREGGMTRVQLALVLDWAQRRGARALLGFALAGLALAVAGTAAFHALLWGALAIAAGIGIAIAGWVPVRGRHGTVRFVAEGALDQILDDLAERD